MNKKSWKEPGYDCRSKCEHKVKGDHGIKAEYWGYAVASDDQRFTLSLEVMTPFYPNTVTPTTGDEFRGRQLLAHAGFVFDRKQLLPDGGGDCDNQWEQCELVEGGQCLVYYRSGVAADDFMREHFVKQFEQPGSFWTALHARMQSLYSDALDNEREASKWGRCTHCSGAGIVQHGK